jgi:hypothetical protein
MCVVEFAVCDVHRYTSCVLSLCKTTLHLRRHNRFAAVKVIGTSLPLIHRRWTSHSADIIENVKEYFLAEWSALGSQNAPVFVGQVESSAANRPPGMSLA